jgi:DNA-binding PadR family transcriptional regulator
LKLPYFQILLALSERSLHGYGIQRAVLEQTDDQLTLWPAMLYRSPAKLEAGGLIEQTAAPLGEPDDERRQYYAMTRIGRECLAEETAQLARWAAAAARRVES